MKKIFLLNGFVVLALIICTGCASIVDGGRRKVQINSNPPGANVTVTDSSGQMVMTGTTPATVRLVRGKGYFGREEYTVKLDREGYYSSQVEINSHLNGWYFGNIAIGGAIGFLIVDPLTGSMWTLKPNKIDWNLVSTADHPNLSGEQLKSVQEAANPLAHKVSAPAQSGAPKQN